MHATVKSARQSTWSLKECLALLTLFMFVFLLLPPAVLTMREAARRQTCRNNLRALGLALHAYHDVHDRLPAAANWGSEGLDLPNLLSHEDPTPVEVTRDNWVQMLLPFLKRDDVAAQFDSSQPVVGPQNRAARIVELSTMTCPSDSYHREDNFYDFELPDGSHALFARGNYAINGGSEFVMMNFGTLANPGPTDRFHYDERTREFQWWGNGIAGINKCFSLRDIDNGLSTTVALEELRAGLNPIDPRGVWALGQIGGSITWGHGISGDARGPNFMEADTGADDIRHAPELYRTLGKKFIEDAGMHACSYCDENAQATSRSMHPDGVNVLMLDGSVHFVANTVEPSLWHVMHARETPAEIFNPETLTSELSGKFTPGEARSRIESEAVESLDGRSSSKSVVNSLGMNFVLVPKGSFTMGVPNRGKKYPSPDDAVPHHVTISRPFYMGVHEVTQEQYEQVMAVNPSSHAAQGEFRDRVMLAETLRCPVENVSWDDATEFCRRLSHGPEEKAAGRIYRLPTEAEWEYACRAGRDGGVSRIPLGPTNDSAREANQPIDLAVPVPVGSLPPNPFGLHEMCSNVYEWVADYRQQRYYKHSPASDPRGPASGYLRVVRGWYWVATGPACKVYVTHDPWTGSPFIGFRVVAEIVKGDAA